MKTLFTIPITDLLVILIANLFNVATLGIMLSRPAGLAQLERTLGLFIILILGFPLFILVLLHAWRGREWWTFTLPAILLSFILLEAILDYILQIEFRQTRLLGPYLLLFYAGQMVMVGYAFLTRNALGAMTLITYFACLGATWYSYRQVGHGI